MDVSENDFDSDLKTLLQKMMPNNKSIHFSFRGKNSGNALQKAMSHASKQQTGKAGSLDVVYSLKSKSHGSFLVIIETKNNPAEMINGNADSPNVDKLSTVHYAVNGILWYAKHIYKSNSAFDRIFALGITGNINDYHISPYYVEKGIVNKAPSVNSLKPFTTSQIDNYFGIGIKHEQSKAQQNKEQLRKQASDLNNDIRDLTGVNNDDKAPLIASILLAMFYEHKNGAKLLDELNGRMDEKNDGAQIMSSVNDLLTGRVKKHTLRSTEKDTIIRAFNFLKDKSLYQPQDKIGHHSPLWKFTKDLADDFGFIKSGTDEDVLGDFYSQFVKYANSDGKGLGIVLTPSRVTKLMAEMIHVDYRDYLLDPVAGSATFLVSGMNRMLKSVPDDANKSKRVANIKRNQLIGVERDDHIYSIAVSNMILRGDGNSNIINDNFFNCGLQINNKKQLKRNYSNYIKVNHPITKVLMNPPYAQGKKNKSEAEIHFIKHALEMLNEGGKLSAIIPISVVVSGGTGVSKTNFRQWKDWILQNCQVLSILTMNPNTFYPTGAPTVIINIKKHQGGQGHLKTKLINFADDGYSLVPKHGMQPNGTELSKEKHLLDVLENGASNSSFVQTVQLTSDNAWLFNAHYTNPNHPTDADFEKTMEDYLTFKTNMELHGRSYLFNEGGENND